jgi:acyl carrier protein
MFVKQQSRELMEVVQYVGDNLAPQIERLASEIVKCFKAGGKVILMGNGGSAGDAQHIAAEFVGRYKKERKSYPALALNANTSTLTAVGNDYGYDVTFSRQVEGFAKKGDVVIGIIERFVEPERRGKLENAPDTLVVAEELGLDSLTMVEVVLAVEDATGATVGDDEVQKLRTLGDIKNFIKSKVSQ